MKIFTKNNNKKSAFSLIELSIVILIVSILITGSLSISKTSISNQKNKVTQEKIDEIYQAILNFTALNKRLPCPAIITAAKWSSTYGDEADTPGTCSSLIESGNLRYGMVPIKALGLDIEMAEDGFGSKFSYIVDSRFTKKLATASDNDGFEGTRTIDTPYDGISNDEPDIIRIDGPSGTEISGNSIMVIISHGANKFGAYNAEGSAANAASSDADEMNNDADGLNATFIAYSSNPDFDDLTLFKEKYQIIRDAGMEFIACSGDEARDDRGSGIGAGIAPNSWEWNSEYYSSEARNSNNMCSNGITTNTPSTNKAAKKCGRFGVWSDELEHGDCSA